MITGAGVDAAGLGAARVRREVVDRHVDRAARAQRAQVLGEQRALERRRVVVVDLRALVGRQVALVAVVRVVLDRHAALGRHRAASLCATVVLPEPVPPAIPTTSGRDIGGAISQRDGGCHDAKHQRRHVAADVDDGVLARSTSSLPTVSGARVREQLVELRA